MLIGVIICELIVCCTPLRSVSTIFFVSANEPEESYLYNPDNRIELAIPKALVESTSFDTLIDVMKKQAIDKVNGNELPIEGFRSFLKLKFKMTQAQFDIIMDTIDKLSGLFG